MARDLSQLSIAEISARFLRDGAPVTPRLLGELRRDPRRGVQRLYETLRRRQEREREERLRSEALLHFERMLWRSGVRRVAGVDEAGAGPLAGPVVAAAVVFPPEIDIPGVDDSKRLAAERRSELAAVIRERAAGVGVGLAGVEEIDRLNIYRAALLAMRRAVEALPEPPEHLLVDARTIPDTAVPQSPIAKGDSHDFSIAAASIVAKTHRDALMEELDGRYPGYGFAQHKGYGTRAHQRAIRELGPSPAHRQSFSFLRELRGECSERFYALRAHIAGAGTAEILRAAEEELESRRGELAEAEQRKLRTLVRRRWKSVAKAPKGARAPKAAPKAYG